MKKNTLKLVIRRLQSDSKKLQTGVVAGGSNGGGGNGGSSSVY